MISIIRFPVDISPPGVLLFRPRPVCPLVKNLGCSVPWTCVVPWIMRPWDDASLGRCVPLSKRPRTMCPDPLGQTNLMLGYMLGPNTDTEKYLDAVLSRDTSVMDASS
jgi:hypothetical protein